MLEVPDDDEFDNPALLDSDVEIIDGLGLSKKSGISLSMLRSSSSSVDGSITMGSAGDVVFGEF